MKCPTPEDISHYYIIKQLVPRNNEFQDGLKGRFTLAIKSVRLISFVR